MSRRKKGTETWKRLLEWDNGQAPSERMAALVLKRVGFTSVDPSHPLGGPDGLKDIVLKRDNIEWIAAVYFPRGQQSFGKIKNKFEDDLSGVESNDADGFVFFTNQELKLSEREELDELTDHPVNIFHLERISSILNSTECYGIRLDFLDIEMTKEEQLSFYSLNQKTIDGLKDKLDEIIESLNEKSGKSLTEITPEEADKIVVESEILNSSSIFGERISSRFYHKCSNCGFGFIVKSDPTTTTNFQNFSKNRIMVNQEYEVVTCPKCSNVDEISSPLF